MPSIVTALHHLAAFECVFHPTFPVSRSTQSFGIMASPILSSFEEQARCRLVVIMESEAEGRGSRKRALETAPEATYGGAWVYALSTPTLDSWYRDRRAVATSVSTTFTSHLSSLTTRQFRLFSPLLPRPLAAPLADKPNASKLIKTEESLCDVELRPTCYLPIINTFVHEVPEMKDSMPRYGETLCGGIRWMEAFGCGGIVLVRNPRCLVLEYMDLGNGIQKGS
ncbi:hypothetical protein B0H13DRAFT_1896243 [Mycena leptocephala]|nr:hypothetical protein B0H13DRAFT_1896243 [Mycena leptocephala]